MDTPISEEDGVIDVMLTARLRVTDTEWVTVEVSPTTSVTVTVTLNVPAAANE